MDRSEWEKLMSSVEEIQEWFPDGVVFIGGIAVYAHAMNDERTAAMAAYSHDADFMILLSDFADLRDIEVVTPNKRLAKQQFIKNGFEFDVYVEYQNDLPVPADEAAAFSVMRSGIRVACLEHLVILKTKAFLDRQGTSKGNKDEDDLVRIFFQLNNPDPEALCRLTETDIDHLEKALNKDAYLRVSNGNDHIAKNIKSVCLENFNTIKGMVKFSKSKECKDDTPEP